MQFNSLLLINAESISKTGWRTTGATIRAASVCSWSASLLQGLWDNHNRWNAYAFYSKIWCFLREIMQNYNIVNATKSVSVNVILSLLREAAMKMKYIVHSADLSNTFPPRMLIYAVASAPHPTIVFCLNWFCLSSMRKQGKRKWKWKPTTSFFML